jgi:hypothetical protein
MAAIASCGHATSDGPNGWGWLIALRDYDRAGDRVIRSGHYCAECRAVVLASGDVLHNETQERAWLAGKPLPGDGKEGSDG